MVIDDRWQRDYGRAEPDPAHWPDLRAWIADRHAAGMRVLLWWKAWDPAGVPAEECVLDPSGRAMAVDPGNPAYLARLREMAAQLVHGRADQTAQSTSHNEHVGRGCGSTRDQNHLGHRPCTTAAGRPQPDDSTPTLC